MSFKRYYNRLMGDVSGLDYLKAKDCINYAWRDIREARRWSFLSTEASIDIPDQVTTGTAAVTQFSDLVVPDAAAKAVWDVLGMNIPLTSRQFRVGSGPLYQIIAYDDSGAGSMQLERSYKETTDADTTYSIYRAYFTMPADFLMFTDVKDIQNGRSLNSDLSRQDLDDWKDPQRQSYGDPYYIAARGADSSGEPVFELWPHLLTAKSLVVRYERAGTDFASDTEALPVIIPESLLMEKALVYACQWAAINRLKDANWQQAAIGHDALYRDQLQKVRLLDEETFPINITYAPEYTRRGGGDARYMQSHTNERTF